MQQIGAPRSYPHLPDDLALALRAIRPVDGGRVIYYPCAVTLRDGSKLDNVYLSPADQWISVWGVWPDEDRGKKEVPIEKVAALQPSSSRLPDHIADKIYRAGESGMGYSIFTLIFSDGSRQAYGTGNAVDFIEYPDGKSQDDVVDVIPHEGRDDPNRKRPVEYIWCLFSNN